MSSETILVTLPSERQARRFREQFAAQVGAGYQQAEDVYVYEQDGQKAIVLERIPNTKNWRVKVKDG